MPVLEAAQGCEPADWPVKSELIPVWTMNFAAGCGDASPEVLNTRGERQPIVHPLFLASCVEVVGAFGSLYAAGLTKQELVHNTFVHHFCDVQLARSLRAGETVLSEAVLARVEQRRNGIHTGTSFTHRDAATGVVLARGYFGGVLLGMYGADAKPAETEAFAPSRPPVVSKASLSGHFTFIVPATAAHVWDAVIRNPRMPKKPSSDINVHTNVGLAEKAGLPARTMNGLGLLSVTISQLARREGSCALGRIRRVYASFSAPLYLDEADVPVVVRHTQLGGARELRFVVELADGSAVLKEGLLEFEPEGGCSRL